MSYMIKRFLEFLTNLSNFEKAHFVTMEMFGEKFMRITSNSEDDIKDHIL